MQKQSRLKQSTSVKTTVRYRLLYTAGATLAVALLVGVGIFFYGNFGNNTESRANSKSKAGIGHLIQNIFAPKGPSAIGVTGNDGKVALTWLNGNDTKVVLDADGVLILRKNGIVTEEQSLTEMETDSAKYAAASSINGWNIIYNGNIVRSFTDNNCPTGKYTYLVYLRKNGTKYTSAKNAARAFVFNGTGLSETLSTKAIIDGMYLPNGCTLTIDKSSTLGIKSGTTMNIGGTFVLGGDLDDESKGWIFSKGGQFVYDRNGGMTGVPVATWEKGSACIMKGISNKIPPGLDQVFDNFTWDCKEQSTDLTLPKQISANGTIIVQSTGAKLKTLWFEGVNTFKGDVIVNDATAKINTRSKSQFVLSGTAPQTISGTCNLQTVTFNNPTSIYCNGIIAINKALNMTNGSIASLGGTAFKIADNAIVTRNKGSVSTSILFAGTYDLIYQTAVTTGAELSSNASALRNLTIDCNGAVTLDKTASINGTLLFTNGKIVTGTYEVNMKDNSANDIKGFSSTSYIAGNLRRSVNGKSDYDFPVGTTANYELINVNLYSTKGFSDLQAHFTASKPDATPLAGNLMLNGSAISNMLDYGYWTVAPNSPLTAGTVSVTLNERGQTNSATSVRCYSSLTRTDASMPWQTLGKHSMKTQLSKNGTVTASRSKLTSLGDFVIGFSDISLLLYQTSYSVNLNKDMRTDVSWLTSGDLNYSSLEVERSQDAYGFEKVGELKEGREKGSTTEYTFTDKNPLPGTSYYRVKQTDTDGKISYSDIKFINNDSKTNTSASNK